MRRTRTQTHAAAHTAEPSPPRCRHPRSPSNPRSLPQKCRAMPCDAVLCTRSLGSTAGPGASVGGIRSHVTSRWGRDPAWGSVGSGPPAERRPPVSPNKCCAPCDAVRRAETVSPSLSACPLTAVRRQPPSGSYNVYCYIITAEIPNVCF